MSTFGCNPQIFDQMPASQAIRPIRTEAKPPLSGADRGAQQSDTGAKPAMHDPALTPLRWTFSWPVVRNSLIVGAIVGTILNMINQGEYIAGMARSTGSSSG